MINEVRNNVMFILNKDNRGYITPMEFNTYARQAQLDIFQKYMYEYSNAIIKQNARYHGEGYSNISKRVSEIIDRFSEYQTMLYNSISGILNVPSDCYYVEKIIYNNNVEVDRVDHSKILNLINSNLTAPTAGYPAYIMTSDPAIGSTPGSLTVYPNSLMNPVVPPVPPSTTAPSNVQIRYIRYPKDPEWTITLYLVVNQYLIQQTRSFKTLRFHTRSYLILFLRYYSMLVYLSESLKLFKTLRQRRYKQHNKHNNRCHI
jgi:hypothetical protein